MEVDSSENAVIISCPHSFIYDPEIQSCVRIVNVKDEILKEIESGLRSEIPLNFECPENGLHADPKDKQKFYSCSFGTAYSMDCPAGFVFNPQISVCDWSKYNIEPLGFQCPGDGLYPDPENVHKFYSCSHGKAYSMDCPGELVFNPKISVCDWPKYNIEPLGFQCPGDGIYPDPENVQKFYSCANENGFNMDCPGGLVFNPDISVCDWPKYSGDAPEEEIKVKHVGSEEAFKYYYKVLLNTM